MWTSYSDASGAVDGNKESTFSVDATRRGTDHPQSTRGFARRGHHGITAPARGTRGRRPQRGLTPCRGGDRRSAASHWHVIEHMRYLPQSTGLVTPGDSWIAQLSGASGL